LIQRFDDLIKEAAAVERVETAEQAIASLDIYRA
jgi:hypothetical protein